MDPFVKEAADETGSVFQELSTTIRPHISQMDEQYQSVCAAHDARSGKAKKHWPKGMGSYTDCNDVRGRAQAGPSEAVTSFKITKQTQTDSQPRSGVKRTPNQAQSASAAASTTVRA